MRAAEGHALEPQFQRLPVNAGDNAQGQERHAQEGTEQGCGRPVARFARNGSKQQFTLGIVVVDAGQLHAALQVKAEAVATFDFVEGRNVEQLGCRHFLAIAQGLAVAMQQIAVRAAEGVVDLGQDGDQRPAAVVAIPEADRIEDVAEHAREGLQHNLAVGRQAMLAQQAFDPR